MSHMYNERLNKMITHLCHVWEEQAAEHEGKMRALANSIVTEHEAERFNTQKAFKSALSSKNNEINALLSECKKLKALLTHIHTENKELQKKLIIANKTIETLRVGHGQNSGQIPGQGLVPGHGQGQGGNIYDENGVLKSTFSDDGTYISNDDTLSGHSGAELYGSLEDYSNGNGQLPGWNQSIRQQSHLYPPRERNPADEMYNYNSGVFYPEGESRGPPPPAAGGGISGLFSSSNQSSFPPRSGPSQSLVYGGRFVLEGVGGDDHPLEDFQSERTSSYDLTRQDREGDEIHVEALSEVPAHQQLTSKRLSPSAPSFMPSFAQNPIGRGIPPPAGLGTSPTLRSGPPSFSSAELNPPPPGFESYSESEPDRSIVPPLPGISGFSVGGSPFISDDDKSSLSSSGQFSAYTPSSIPNGTHLGGGSGGMIDTSPNDAVNLLTQMRLQSKSSKHDAKPVSSSPLSPSLSSGLGAAGQGVRSSPFDHTL